MNLHLKLNPLYVDIEYITTQLSIQKKYYRTEKFGSVQSPLKQLSHNLLFICSPFTVINHKLIAISGNLLHFHYIE